MKEVLEYSNESSGQSHVFQLTAYQASSEFLPKTNLFLFACFVGDLSLRQCVPVVSADLKLTT